MLTNQNNQNEMFNDLLDPSLLEHLESLEPEQKNWPSLLLELHEIVQKRLAVRGIDMPELAFECVLDIGEHIGGMQVYLPRGDRLRMQIRDIKIWNEFNGSNINALTRKYKLTAQSIYKICAKMRKIESAKRQPDLFS